MATVIPTEIQGQKPDNQENNIKAIEFFKNFLKVIPTSTEKDSLTDTDISLSLRFLFQIMQVISNNSVHGYGDRNSENRHVDFRLPQNEAFFKFCDNYSNTLDEFYRRCRFIEDVV